MNLVDEARHRLMVLTVNYDEYRGGDTRLAHRESTVTAADVAFYPQEADEAEHVGLACRACHAVWVADVAQIRESVAEIVGHGADGPEHIEYLLRRATGAEVSWLFEAAPTFDG